jgi:hypothetical protein
MLLSAAIALFQRRHRFVAPDEERHDHVREDDDVAQRQDGIGATSNTPADGECMTVTDVVIVDGQETRAPKRMCRRPPNNRFVRV